MMVRVEGMALLEVFSSIALYLFPLLENGNNIPYLIGVVWKGDHALKELVSSGII